MVQHQQLCNEPGFERGTDTFLGAVVNFFHLLHVKKISSGSYSLIVMTFMLNSVAHLRHAAFFCWQLDLTASEVYRSIKKAVRRRKAVCEKTVKCCYAQFAADDFSLTDRERSGRPEKITKGASGRAAQRGRCAVGTRHRGAPHKPRYTLHFQCDYQSASPPRLSSADVHMIAEGSYTGTMSPTRENRQRATRKVQSATGEVRVPRHK